MVGHYEKECLMVIILDRLSSIIQKGEVTERYYNPGNTFKQVHIVLMNDDCPDFDEVQKMVGRAELFIHNLPPPGFMRSFGWNTLFLKSWVKSGLALTKIINPNLIRTHSNFLDGYLAREIKKMIGIPYVVSLHTVRDRDSLYTPLHILRRLFQIKYERLSLIESDAVIAVYMPIIRYAKSHGAQRVELIYNIVGNGVISKKNQYNPSRPIQILNVNRQLFGKNPENIIRAIVDIDCEYTLIGDGPYHGRLIELARSLGIESKVNFIKAIPNKELCEILSTFDFIVTHCDYAGISKSIIEGALAGMPMILNKPPAEHVPDLDGDWVFLCENNPFSYHKAIKAFVDNKDLRISYGERAYKHASLYFEPSIMEKKTVDLYADLLS
jgi:glycosyltransferase involved in cell wall biosynthesis